MFTPQETNPDPQVGTSLSEPLHSLRSGDKNVPWWIPNIDGKITDKIRDLLESYSHIPREDIVKHVYETRERAWAIRSYPCTGLGAWLQPLISTNPAYPEILQRAKAGGTVMDIGCFLGVDLRQLARDGVPSKKLYGVDIVSHWDVGFFFFRDQDRFEGHFIEADLLKAEESALAAMAGSVDAANITHVMHQWNYATQRAACMQMVKLTRGVGALVLGFQCGTRAGTAGHGDPFNKEAFWHDEESMGRMWAESGERTGTKWEVKVEMRDITKVGGKREELAYLGEDVRLLHFIAHRLK